MQTHQLERKLKALKLGGMMDTLELRTEEAQKGNLGYLVFLEMLLEDEDNRRSQKALSGRLRKARFEESRTLSDFDFTYNPKIPAPLIRDLATCGYLERKESVLLYGPVGVGEEPHRPGPWPCRLHEGLQRHLHKDQPPVAGPRRRSR